MVRKAGASVFPALFSRELPVGREKMRMGVSSCLLGEQVRYDGGSKPDRYVIRTLGRLFELVPVCPEFEAGYPVPRPPFRLVDDPADPRLITPHDGKDHTQRMKEWSERRLDELAELNLCGFIFKTRSPSCGLNGVEVFRDAPVQPATGAGLFAAALVARFPSLPVLDNERLCDPVLRDDFLRRANDCHRRCQ